MEASGALQKEIINMLKTSDPVFAKMTDREVQAKTYGALYYRRNRNGTILRKGPKLVPPPSAAPAASDPVTVVENAELRRWCDLDPVGKRAVLGRYHTLREEGETPMDARAMMEPDFASVALPPVGVLASIYSREYGVVSQSASAIQARKQRRAVRARSIASIPANKERASTKAVNVGLAAIAAKAKDSAKAKAKAKAAALVEPTEAPVVGPLKKIADEIIDRGEKRNVTLWISGVEVALSGNAEDIIKIQTRLWRE